MVVLMVLAALGLLLGAGCWWEARTGRPEWRADRVPVDPAVRRAQAREAGTSAAVAFWVADGGGDGS